MQYTLNGVMLTADQVVQKMQQNNVFTIAKRNVEGQDMLYQSIKLTNNIWVLNELKIQPGSPDITVSYFYYLNEVKCFFYECKVYFKKLLVILQLSLKSRSVEVASGIFQVYNAILHS